jgi:Uma2 family endonuclease
MSDTATSLPLTEAAFFDLIAGRPGRYELHDGEMYAMAGGSEAHALIGTNTLTALSELARRRGCRTYGGDFYIRPPERGAGDSALSPDAWVRCGPVVPTSHSASDPVVVVEVLSPSTMVFDRGDKLERYFTVPSLQHVLLLYQHAMRAELWTRTPREDGDDQWLVTHHEDPAGHIPLAALDGSLALADLYLGLELTAAP